MTAETPFDPDAYTGEARKNWSDAAPDYEKISSAYFQPITESFLLYSSIKPGKKILDVACGPGTVTLQAAKLAGPEGRVTGTDLAPGMLALAKERAAAAGLSNIDFIEANAEALTFPDDSFDAVFCQLGLMLFAKPQDALKEMVRVAKKGATVSCLVQGAADKMVFSSLLMKCTLKHAPQIKVPGAPNLYAFGPQGALEFAFHRAGMKGGGVLRKQGTFAFDSAEQYWETLTAGSGRMRMFLASLKPEVSAAIRRDTLEAASAYLANGKLAIPYEFVMAKGVKPS